MGMGAAKDTKSAEVKNKESPFTRMREPRKGHGRNTIKKKDLLDEKRRSYPGALAAAKEIM